MATLQAPRRESAPLVMRRRTGSFERLWDRIEVRARRVEAQAAAEREEARTLLDELMRLPGAGQRFEALEREPRFWSLGMAEHLLAAATPESSADPARALHLAELALAVVRRLTPADYAESLLGEQEVVA